MFGRPSAKTLQDEYDEKITTARQKLAREISEIAQLREKNVALYAALENARAIFYAAERAKEEAAGAVDIARESAVPMIVAQAKGETLPDVLSVPEALLRLSEANDKLENSMKARDFLIAEVDKLRDPDTQMGVVRAAVAALLAHSPAVTELLAENERRRQQYLETATALFYLHRRSCVKMPLAFFEGFEEWPEMQSASFPSIQRWEAVFAELTVNPEGPLTP